MIKDYFGKCKEYFKEAVKKMKSTERRVLLGAIVEDYGIGGQTDIAREFGVGRNTIRKGHQEHETGKRYEDEVHKRGRKPIEEILVNLTKDIKDIVEPECQTDPTFDSTRLYTRLTIPTIRKLLIEKKDYTDEELPSNVTLNRIVNECGYKLKRVMKVRPIKKIKETDAIFENLAQVHREANLDDNIVRLSIDAKDKVKVGEFSRGGKSRTEKEAFDHDFGNDFITPFGILNVKTDEVDIRLVKSKVTADFIVDFLEEHWDNNFKGVKDTLLLNCDNGPESNSKRTQFLKRMIEFSAKSNIEIILAYYPPYHSKYNPIERIWGKLEQHWNGDLLDSLDTIEKFTKSMTWKGKNPNISIADKSYETGKTIKKKTMKVYETAIERASEIGKWFLKIKPEKAKEILKIADLR